MNRNCCCKANLRLNTTPTQPIKVDCEQGSPFLNLNSKDTGPMGPVGPQGNGIDRIEKTSTSGLVDTYTIYYTDGNTTTFDVNNGEKGDTGPAGKDAKINGVNTLTLNAQNGLSYSQSGSTLTISGVALQNSISNLQDTKQDKLNQNQLNAVNSGITSSKVTTYDSHVSNATIHVTQQDKTTWNGKQNALNSTQMEAVNSGITSAGVSQITTNKNNIAGEVTNRQNADNGLQSQIDAIVASSDVTDIVGTYAELQAYDTSSLPPNSIIKVLQDESQNDETTYYRWVINGGVGSWVLIGEEGPYYTKSEADARFATAAQGAKADSSVQSVTTGNTNGTLSVDGTDVAVKGLGSAAYTPSTDYATAAQGAKADTAIQPTTTRYQALNVQYKNDIVPQRTIDLSTVTVDKGEATYGFSYDSNLDALVSENVNVDESYAYGKIEVTVSADTTMTVYYEQESETGYDYGEISELDSYLSYNNQEDLDAKWSGRDNGYQSGSVEYTLTAGTHFFTFKYLKDVSVGEPSDCLRITGIVIAGYGSKKLIDYDNQEDIPVVMKSDISTSVDASSTNEEVVGSKLFYDTCGDIETLINAL